MVRVKFESVHRKGRKRDVNMEIKNKNSRKDRFSPDNRSDDYIKFRYGSKYNIIELVDMNEGCVHELKLSENDCLNIAKGLFGQEEARQNELTSLRKKVEIQDLGIPSTMLDENGKPLRCTTPLQYESPKSDKDIENQKIVNAVIEIAKTGDCTMTMGLVNRPEFDIESFKDLLKHVPSNTDAFYKNNYAGLMKDL